jgi:hypothetical protein
MSGEGCQVDSVENRGPDGAVLPDASAPEPPDKEE